MYTLRLIYKTGMIKNYSLGEEYSSITKFPPRSVSEENNRAEFEREMKLFKEINPVTIIEENDVVAFVLSEGEEKTYPITYDKTAYIIGEKGNTIAKIN